MTTQEKLAEAAKVLRGWICDGREHMMSKEHDALSLLCSAAEGGTVGEERSIGPAWGPCKTCEFCRQAAATGFYSDQTACKRMPPVTTDEGECPWPLVDDTYDGCGEHKEAKR